ncbi:TetR family transcriptional regulator [Propionicimonas paludicola]|uniref:TetR family transcriptional regulator n=1 Tax=Propionicimonas paludicola TaxID=185243 RepID=A0A2A9CUW1_9ACTN|nr:TetR/AcrR family transcriptional regulator [Propionicimonas paludicola]PFG17432.1 TetR family transcriptional regulator [Propionicimonas paludicola]
MPDSALARVNWEHLPLRRVPSQARSRDKVIRALKAADEIVAADGAAAVNLSSVAERAGVSVGALYQYLPDRDAILAALSWRYHARLEALLDEVVADARRRPPTSNPVGYVIDAVAEIYREEASARSLRGSAGLPSFDEQRQAHRARMAAKVAELLQVAGITSSGRKPTPMIAAVAFTTADALLHEAFAAAEPERSQILEELRLVARGYLQARADD